MEVLFPAPLGPRNPKISPRRTESVRSRTAGRPPNSFRRLRASMARSGTDVGYINWPNSPRDTASAELPYPVSV